MTEPKIHCLYDKLVDIKKLIPHPKNPNRHSNEQIERLAKILEYQGFRYPIKVSKLSGFITSGHGRISASKLNEWKKVPVVYQDYENEEQEYADVVADNSVASWAELDLSAVNAELENLGPDFDLEMLGMRNFLLEPAEKFLEEKHWSEELPDMDRAQDAWKIVVTCFKEEDAQGFLKELGVSDVKSFQGGKLISLRWPAEK